MLPARQVTTRLDVFLVILGNRNDVGKIVFIIIIIVKEWAVGLIFLVIVFDFNVRNVVGDIFFIAVNRLAIIVFSIIKADDFRTFGFGFFFVSRSLFCRRFLFWFGLCSRNQKFKRGTAFRAQNWITIQIVLFCRTAGAEAFFAEFGFCQRSVSLLDNNRGPGLQQTDPVDRRV